MMGMKNLVFLAICALTAVEAQQQKLYSVSNAQAERCMNARFKKASEIDRDLSPDGVYENKAPSTTAHMAQDEMAEVSYPNVEWDQSVPLAQWSLETTAKNANFPLGFRRNVLRPNAGGVMCLKIPASYQNHKVEVMVETGVRSAICIADTRQAEINNEANSVTATCDEDGQLVSCFSALSFGESRAYTQDADSGAVVDPDPANIDAEGTVSVPETTDTSTGFALVVGCPGRGCWENDMQIFYRVRVSKATWSTNDGPNQAENNVDMWCMMLEQHSKELYGTTGAEWLARVQQNAAAPIAPVVLPDGTTVPVPSISMTDDYAENYFGQIYPSDLWAERPSDADEVERVANLDGCDLGTNCPDPAVDPDAENNIYGGAASAVQASVVALAMPLLALLW